MLYICPVHVSQHLQQHFEKKKTLVSIGHLKPPKLNAPKTDNQCPCVGTDYCCCRGKALGGA